MVKILERIPNGHSFNGYGVEFKVVNYLRRHSGVKSYQRDK